jgi:hypothetical protein
MPLGKYVDRLQGGAKCEFQEGMWDTQVSALLSSPTVSRLSEGDPTRCARSTARHPPRLRGCVAVRNALPRLAHGRSRLCHPGPTRRRLRAAAPTAESGRVARSSGPQGPLHRRPWLRHRSHRRGPCLRGFQATQSSRTSGHTGMPVCAAVGGPVSAAALKRTLRGWTAPALRWAARRCSGPPSARQRARTDAAPCLTSSPPEGHSGKHRRRCALPVP